VVLQTEDFGCTLCAYVCSLATSWPCSWEGASSVPVCWYGKQVTQSAEKGLAAVHLGGDYVVYGCGVSLR
jgi:hypothetical protein